MQWLSYVKSLTRALLILSLSSAALNAYAECRFNPDANQQTLTNLAKKQANAQVYMESNSIIWEEGELANEIYYGGCDVLKFKVINFIDDTTPLEEEQAFDIAKNMADRFWQKEDAYELAVKLSSNSFNREDVYNDKTLYQYIMNNPDYAEMTMLFDRIDNSITIEWIKQ